MTSALRSGGVKCAQLLAWHRMGHQTAMPSDYS
jgi:hypothetical protein